MRSLYIFFYYNAEKCGIHRNRINVFTGFDVMTLIYITNQAITFKKNRSRRNDSNKWNREIRSSFII